jgi:hypothetical protein
LHNTACFLIYFLAVAKPNAHCLSSIRLRHFQIREIRIGRNICPQPNLPPHVPELQVIHNPTRLLCNVYPLLFLLRDQPALQVMLSLYATLGVFLLLASRNPSAHRSLIAFAAWSSFAHAATMAVQAFFDRKQTRTPAVRRTYVCDHRSSADRGLTTKASKGKRECSRLLIITNPFRSPCFTPKTRTPVLTCL